MTTALERVPTAPAQRVALGAWLWSPSLDLSLFLGSAVAALALVAIGHATGLSDVDLPEWAWLGCVLAIDVAHVYATLFRTYLDGQELRRHPLRYTAAPLFAWAAGVCLYFHAPLTFWRVLAYAALFHFVRQQAGWVALYRAKGGLASRLDRAIDDIAIYAATLYPVLFWHAHLSESEFAWFMRGDFADVARWAAAALPSARLIWAAALGAYALRQVWRGLTTGRIELGKTIVVGTTALIWWIGIVGTNSDFCFTVTNVILHGVPYIGLLWAYARARRREAPEHTGSQIAAGGLAAFLGVLLLLAFAEEMAWDRFVWHERPWLFGDGASLGEPVLALLVPLLAVPQATHYLLDGFLWRRADTRARPAQRAALGL